MTLGHSVRLSSLVTISSNKFTYTCLFSTVVQMVRTTGLKVLHGLFSSTAGPQGLTSDLNAQLISVGHVKYLCSSYALTHTHTPQALYDYQPNLVDTQLLQAWLTVTLSAHTKLFSLNSDLLMAHIPKLFVTCVGSLLSDNQVVLTTAASVMEVRHIISSFYMTTINRVQLCQCRGSWSFKIFCSLLLHSQKYCQE